MIETIACTNLKYCEPPPAPTASPTPLACNKTEHALSFETNSIVAGSEDRRVRFADEVFPTLSVTSSDSRSNYQLEQRYPPSPVGIGCYANRSMLTEARWATNCAMPDAREAVSVSPEEKASRWLTEDEFERTCRKAMQVAQHYAETKAIYVASYFALNDSLSRTRGASPVDCEKTSLAKILVRSSARGLEQFVFPSLCNSRLQAVQDVLDAQDRIPESVDPNTRQRMLSARSLQLSLHARRIARVFGAADAAMAEQLYREEFASQRLGSQSITSGHTER